VVPAGRAALLERLIRSGASADAAERGLAACAM
jgi:hypothetical protein